MGGLVRYADGRKAYLLLYGVKRESGFCLEIQQRENSSETKAMVREALPPAKAPVDRLIYPHKSTILLAEREDASRRKLREILFRLGFAVVEAPDTAAVLRELSHPMPKILVIGSVGNNHWDGVELARQVRTLNKNLPIVFVAAENSEELAIAAFKAGVNDYIRHPFSLDVFIASVRQFLPRDTSPNGSSGDVRSLAGQLDAPRLIGESPVMQEVRARIANLAFTDSNVLITGETGTGKELVAQAIHKRSVRARQPFVCINCAAIPDNLLESELFGYERGAFTGAYYSSKGKLELANGGTVFLDEIGDMSLHAQAKILRAIESREIQRLSGRESIQINVKFIAATNKDLEQAISEKTFRNDLYYRLNVSSIFLPELRQRKEDIPDLCHFYIREFNERFGRSVESLSEEVVQQFLRYDWPGNVRELKNVLEAAVGTFHCTAHGSCDQSCGRCSAVNFQCRQILLADLPDHFRRRLSQGGTTTKDERYPLLSTLVATNWNVSKAAQKLHWSRMTIYRKMAKYHIRRQQTVVAPGLDNASLPRGNKCEMAKNP